VPVVPPLAKTAASNRSEPVLQEIQRTGVLKASLRQDSLPFASIDANGKGTGYCVDLLTGLANQLQTQLNRPVKLEIAVPSTLDNRFDVVKNNAAQVECGPNTITRNPAPGTEFSTPFFITGTHLLVKKSAQVNLQTKLQNVRVGVFSKSTTAGFMQRTYPKAKFVPFQGETAKSDAFQALTSSKIDAVANDGILLISQFERQKLSLQEYTLIPDRPLTCDAYGMILPTDDQQWRTTVNQFIDGQPAKKVWDSWFKTLYPYVLLNIDYCADR
jgi:ABC-type amino acid transport substrate-binding protein